ncbi:MAG: ribose-phosphate pyrophosphokinase [Wenyingzhuangia sp.]|jgi:ribose-phosphate pyrophosphokinase|uniref:ribose-phosphate pyrophosphokinase n=1 Tax=Wenyingzhuangia sp. TaxID=1964193 RepID=UPI003219A256
MSVNQLTPKVFACTQSIELGKSIAKHYGTELADLTVARFSDGEFQPIINETVRGRRVFIIGSTFPNADNLMELLLILDACKRASAKHITAVIPYFGYARQDRKDQPRVAIGAKMVANLLEASGATRVMTMDLHADQIQGFFEKPVDHLYGSTIFLPYLDSLKLDNLTIASPDMGGSKRAYAYAKYLKSNVVICYKQRAKANVVSHMELIGHVEGQHVVLVDDMADTAGTLTKAADLMIERGALSVRAIVTHSLLSGNAHEKIKNSKLTEFITSDTIPLKEANSKIKVLSCAPLFAEVMEKVQNFKSITDNFII